MGKGYSIFLDKILSTGGTTLIENDKIVNKGSETANMINTFFSNIAM